MQAVKIASIASIVKRPSPDESQPKWVLLPGRAALLSSVSRGILACLGFLCLFFLVFVFVFFCQEYYRLSEFMLGIFRLPRFIPLLCQRPVVQKSLRCLAWKALCTFFSASLCFDCMCDGVRKSLLTDWGDYNQFSMPFFFLLLKLISLKKMSRQILEATATVRYHLDAALSGFSNLPQDA